MCVPLVGTGKPELTPAESDERSRYADQAVQVLREAIDAGFKEFDSIEKGAELKAIRNLPGFLELMAGRLNKN